MTSDSMIADRLLQRQRTEVEDEIEGLNSISCDEVIVKGVLLTESPNAANPMAQVLKSLKIKLDVVRETNSQPLPTRSNVGCNLHGDSKVSADVSVDSSRVSFPQPLPPRPNIGRNLHWDSKPSADISVDGSRVSFPQPQPPRPNVGYNLDGDSKASADVSVDLHTGNV